MNPVITESTQVVISTTAEIETFDTKLSFNHTFVPQEGYSFTLPNGKRLHFYLI